MENKRIAEQYRELQEQYQLLQEKYEQMRLNEEMYRVAIGMTDHTISVVDIEKRTLNQIHNEGSYTDIVSSMENAPESIIATGIIHPEDCEGYRQFYREIYAGSPEGRYTMRVIEENRGWVWFEMIYQTVFDENGKPIRAICFSDDITKEKRAEEKYLHYRESVTANADQVWEVNLTKNKILHREEKVADVYMLDVNDSYDELSRRALEMVDDFAQKEKMRMIFGREELLEAFHCAKREISMEHEMDFRDGRGCRWFHSTAHLMTNSNEEVIAILCSTDITERHKELKILEIRAERDSLTGLYNRNSFRQRAEKVLEEYPKNRQAFLMIDVDDFKHFNDNYGHAFGDIVLQTISKVMQKTFRVSDILGRFGGDEFVVFMRNIKDEEAIHHRAQNLLEELERTCIQRSFPVSVTLSIGVAVSDEGENLKSISNRADTAMYRSKKGGKNRITLLHASEVAQQ